MAAPFSMFMNAGISLETSIFLNEFFLSTSKVYLGIFFSNTDEYLTMISFLFASSTISVSFSSALIYSYLLI